MRVLKVFFVFIILTSLFSCIKPISTDFIMDKTEYSGGDIVTLKNTSKGASSYKWTFPDGTTSLGKNAVYRISDNAVYGVQYIKLEAYGIGRQLSKTETKALFVYPAFGKVVFWKKASCNCGYIDVTIDDDQYIGFGANYTSSPGCDDPYACVFNLTVGTHYYSATNGSRSWNGNFTITKDGCLDIELN